MLPSPVISISSLSNLFPSRFAIYAPIAAGKSYPIDATAEFDINLWPFFIMYECPPTTQADPFPTTVI